jgi:hypothetical protein
MKVLAMVYLLSFLLVTLTFIIYILIDELLKLPSTDLFLLGAILLFGSLFILAFLYIESR